jgi:hypothetical protein
VEDVLTLLGWQEPWAPGERSLGEAWRVCPDGRWMFASAVFAGVGLRSLAKALCVCVRDIGPTPAPTWSRVVEAAEAYARGEEGPESIRRALPPLPAAESGPEGMRRLVAAARLHGGEECGAYEGVFWVMLGRSLQPDIGVSERARAGSRALGVLAAIRALRARRESRESAVRLLAEVEDEAGSTLAVLAGRALLEPESSHIWDDAAARAFGHTLSLCAEHFRRSVPSPYPACTVAGQPGRGT